MRCCFGSAIYTVPSIGLLVSAAVPLLPACCYARTACSSVCLAWFLSLPCIAYIHVPTSHRAHYLCLYVCRTHPDRGWSPHCAPRALGARKRVDWCDVALGPRPTCCPVCLATNEYIAYSLTPLFVGPCRAVLSLLHPSACTCAGRIPTEICHLTALAQLCLDHNKLTGALLLQAFDLHGAVDRSSCSRSC